MSRIVKFIFRFDYDLNYSFLDKQGTVFKMLSACSIPDFWDGYAERARNRAFIAAYTNIKEGVHREMTLEPTCINGVVELAQGIDIDDILECTELREFDKIADVYLREFGIDNLRRAGIRAFIFDSYGDGFSDHVGKFRSLLNNQFINNFDGAFGAANNSSIVFHGNSPNGLNYRIALGHTHELDPYNVYQSLDPRQQPAILALHKKYHYMADIDLFENNTALNRAGLKRWTRDKWPVMKDFMALLKKQITSI